MSGPRHIGTVLPSVVTKPLHLRPPKEELVEIPMGRRQPSIFITAAEFAERGGRTVTTPDGRQVKQLGYCQRHDGEWLYWGGGGEDAIETAERYRELDARCKAGRSAKPKPRTRLAGFEDDYS